MPRRNKVPKHFAKKNITYGVWKGWQPKNKMSCLESEIIQYAGKRSVTFHGKCMSQRSFQQRHSIRKYCFMYWKIWKTFSSHLPTNYIQIASLSVQKLIQNTYISASYSNTCRFSSFEFNRLPSILQWESSDNNRWMTRIMGIPNWSPRADVFLKQDLEYIVSSRKSCRSPCWRKLCSSFHTFSCQENVVSSCFSRSNLGGKSKAIDFTSTRTRDGSKQNNFFSPSEGGRKPRGKPPGIGYEGLKISHMQPRVGVEPRP